MTKRTTRGAFTLVELLVVIGIIALLISILLPVLGKAREAANKTKCMSNLRSIGQGLLMYVADNKGTFPAAYIYSGMTLTATDQQPTVATQGYIHWSSFIYGARGRVEDMTAFSGTSGWDAFRCPSMDTGGLPPTNTYDGNLDPGQQNDVPGVIDQMAPRCAYTVNEAICPRNKFVIGFQGAVRKYQYVRAGSIKQAAGTVLATEFIADWHVVSEAGRDNPSAVSKSHRPVHGFVGISGQLNMELVDQPNSMRSQPMYRRVAANEINPDVAINATSQTRLDWIGRNHGTGKYKDKVTCFLYVDGHVDSKRIEDTVAPQFQWGETFYSLNPNGDLQP